MKRTEEFETRIDALLAEFSDLSYEEIADVFDYYAYTYTAKANRS